MTTARLTHIGGPTALVEAAGWRILTDPTFDAPGRRYGFGWGTSSRKLTGPAIAVDDLGRIDAVLLSHDHHADNLDDAGRPLLVGFALRWDRQEHGALWITGDTVLHDDLRRVPERIDIELTIWPRQGGASGTCPPPTSSAPACRVPPASSTSTPSAVACVI